VAPFTYLKTLFSAAPYGLPHFDDPFIEIDQQRVVASLRLVERGEERGRINQPSQTQSELDVVEYEIVNLISTELNRAQIDAHTQSQTYQNRLTDLKLLQQVHSIKTETVKALGDFNTLVIDWRNKLTTLRDKIRESYSDLRQFKSTNGLERPAEEKPPRVVTIGGIAFGALLEVVGNSFFLQSGDDRGYLGGLFAAVMVAAINVGTAALAGFLVFPRSQVRDRAQKLVARCLIGVWLAFLPTWNLAAAHFRDAKANGLLDPQRAALESLIANPLSLGGIYSWGLFIIGLAAAAITALSAYRADDPFPGYGERDRQHNARCDEYADGVAEAIRNLTGTRDDAIDSAQAVKSELSHELLERDRICSAFARLSARYGQYQSRLEDVTNLLLTTYRDANMRTRTADPPPHFNQRYIIKRSELVPLTVGRLHEAEIAQANAVLGDSISNIGQAFERAINSFATLEQLKAELERGSL
jgi:hypothetical protein